MQVGDLVKCVSANRVIGLVVSIKSNYTQLNLSIFNVLLNGDIYPFRSDMLEVVSASR